MTREEFLPLFRTLRGAYVLCDMPDGAEDEYFTALSKLWVEDERRAIVAAVIMSERTPSTDEILAVDEHLRGYGRREERIEKCRERIRTVTRPWPGDTSAKDGIQRAVVIVRQRMIDAHSLNALIGTPIPEEFGEIPSVREIVDVAKRERTRRLGAEWRARENAS